MDIQERIAAILEEHPMAEYSWGVDPCDCNCGYHGTSELPWHSHAAEVLMSQLGLREEWKTVHESGGGLIYNSYSKARHEFDNFVERPPGVEDPGSGRLTHIASRYVTGWQPA